MKMEAKERTTKVSATRPSNNSSSKSGLTVGLDKILELGEPSFLSGFSGTHF